MNTLAFLNGCFDAGDIPSAAGAILADPISMVLQPRSIERLYRIAFDGANSTPADVVMIGILGDIMAARYRQ